MSEDAISAIKLKQQKMEKVSLLIGTFLVSLALSAQVSVGSIRGKVLDGDDDNNPMIGARVWVEAAGSQRIAVTDANGRFVIEALNPGVYNFYAKALMKDTVLITGVEVKGEGITTLDDISMFVSSEMIGVVIVKYERPLIPKEIQRIEITTDEIAHSPNIRNPKQLFVSMNSDIQMPEGTTDVIIRGSRPGDVIYYIDGVKCKDLNGIPGAAMRTMMGYTGGVPAKYGDTTGGVIALETKSYFDLYYAWKARQ